MFPPLWKADRKDGRARETASEEERQKWEQVRLSQTNPKKEEKKKTKERGKNLEEETK